VKGAKRSEKVLPGDDLIVSFGHTAPVALAGGRLLRWTSNDGPVPMTDQQLEDLVARIGDEMLSRLGLTGAESAAIAPTVSGSSCASGCKTVAPPGTTPPNGWSSRSIELDCRDARLTATELIATCLKARTLELGAVNVLPNQVLAAERSLHGSTVRIVASVGWPHGATSTGAKALEAELALGQGAGEIELVMPIGPLLAAEDDQVFGELRFIAELVHRAGKTMTAVIETTGVDQSRLIAACALARLARVDAICAAADLTGHGTVSAEAVGLFRKVAGDDMEVKASGGVSSASTAHVLASAGADRVTVASLAVASSLATTAADTR
jgi:deoxyribose-phosphate aldolase